MDFENMSREELLEVAKRQAEGLLRYGNHPAILACPFCMGSGVCSLLKYNVKDSLIEEWNRDVTPAEYEGYAAKMREMFKPKETVNA